MPELTGERSTALTRIMNPEKAVETAKYTKHANEQGVARNQCSTRKVQLAGVRKEAFQLLFSRISRGSRSI